MSVLEVKDLMKSFGKTRVLKGVSFTLDEGEVLSIIGSSGSGKTTILRCINQLETADSGKITVDGDIIFDGDVKSKRNARETREKQLKIGLVFQQFNLFPQYNVFDNVTLAVKLKAKEREDYKGNKKQILKEIDENAKKILAEMGLSDKMEAYPWQLSGGQQQRVAIARALALEPKILFFDEPTSALDPELTGEVLKVIKELANQNTTMIIVTHEMQFARELSDRIIFMEQGIIQAQGTPDEIFNSSNERVREFIGKFRS